MGGGQGGVAAQFRVDVVGLYGVAKLESFTAQVTVCCCCFRGACVGLVSSTVKKVLLGGALRCGGAVGAAPRTV